MGMNLFTGEGQSKRCLLQEAQRHDFEMISSILKDNIDAIQLQGQDEQPITLAQSLIDHSDLPPQGQPCQEKTLLILTQATKTVIGMVSFYQGYPTEKTLYIGSLFFLKDFQRQGFGKEVMQYLEQEAVTAGYRESRVVVSLKNWQALRFWLNLGFNQMTQIVGNDHYSETTYADVELVKTKLIAK